MEESFIKAFKEMFIGTAPDLGMHSEITNEVDRYIGKGEETFMYSVRVLKKPENILELINSEIELAKGRGRKTIEWKTYDLLQDEAVERALIDIGFEKRTTLRLMYYPVSDKDFKIKGSNKVEEVTEENFEDLMDVMESVFNHRSLWLKNGLGKEISLRPKLVKAFISYVASNIASAGWIKKYNKIGNLFGGATLEHLRGKGAYQSLVSARYKYAQDNQIDYLISDCTADSERVLRALNFYDGGLMRKWKFTILDD